MLFRFMIYLTDFPGKNSNQHFPSVVWYRTWRVDLQSIPREVDWRIYTVGHRRQVTAVTRLPRWRRRKTRLQVRPLLTMLQDMDSCNFWHANRYWIALTCDTVIFGHHASERSSGALTFSGGRRVTWSKEAGDWGFRGRWLTLQTQFSEAGVEM